MAFSMYAAEYQKGKNQCYRIAVVAICLLLHFASSAQSVLQFENDDLVTILQRLEKFTLLTFNYAPETLKTFDYTGTFDLSNPDKSLTKLLQATPLTFDQRENNVIIFQAAQRTYTFCGWIKDEASKGSLPFANIYTSDYSQGAQSDEQGYFEFQFEAFKNEMIVVSYIGYESFRVPISALEERECTELLLAIDPNLFQQDIIIEDYILDGVEEGQTYSAVQMDYDLLAKHHSNLEHDLLRTVQLIPGITSLDESAANIQIRGSSMDQNLMIWEGATLYNTGHLFGMISSINPFVVEDVKIFKGVFDPSYDDRIGGVIDISLSDSIPKTISGGIGSTFTEAHAYLNVPIIKNRLSFLAAGRKTIHQFFVSPTLWRYRSKVFQDTKVTDEDLEADEELLDYYDWNAKLLFQPSSFLHFEFSLFRSLNAYHFDVPFFEDFNTTDEVTANTIAISSSADLFWNDRWTTTLAYHFSNLDSDSRFRIYDPVQDNSLGSNEVLNHIDDWNISIENRWRANTHWQVQFGTDFNRKDVGFNFFELNTFEPDFKDENEAQGNFFNLFVATQYKKKNLQLDGGIRWTKFLETQNWVASPRLNMQYAVSPNLKLKLSGGILNQYIGQLSQYGANNLGVSNPTWILTITETETNQRSHKLATGFAWQKEGWLLDVDAYSHRTTGLSTYSPLVNSNPFFFDFSTGSSTAKGIDVLVKKNWKHYATWLNYSLSKNEFDFPEIDEAPFPAANDQRHNLSFVNTWNWNNWQFNLTYQYRTGLPYSEPAFLETFYDEEYDEEYFYLEYEDFNTNRLADYSRLDAGVSYKYIFPTSNMQLECGFSLINILDRANQFARTYDFIELEEDPETFEVIHINKLLLERTPMLLLRFRF